ncbi:MAG: hypothetical protein GF411_08660 [Candidatus Lokiarchaeota archaeon]|nr:hypothetical protein [Candidatus Lokiarchaeota archaeon]
MNEREEAAKIKNAVELLLNSGFSIEHDRGLNKGDRMFKIEDMNDHYMIQKSYGSCDEGDFETVYGWFMGSME